MNSASPKERLQKYIANCGYCSRRKAELLIEHGLVSVDGFVIAEIGTKIDPSRQAVEIVGERIEPPPRRTVLMNKPAGFITSTHDTHERLTVLDLLPRPVRFSGVLPAGRLDLETEGLLILTNDGDLQHHITHPRYECEKEYRAVLSQLPSESELDRLRRGVFIQEVGKTTQPARIAVENARQGIVRIAISEGMKRQVRRMFEIMHAPVVHLERIRIGDVELGDLPRGAWRDLSEQEIAALVSNPEA